MGPLGGPEKKNKKMKNQVQKIRKKKDFRKSVKNIAKFFDDFSVENIKENDL